MKLADHAGDYLAKLADEDRRIYVLDGDLADSDGAVHFAKKHPDRFIMAGIAEQNMVSVAAGMAAGGLRPIVFSFAAFLCYRAYDQIRMCICQAAQPVILIASHGTGLAGRNGKSHAALNDLALMLSLPQIDVWAPADRKDVEFAIRTALQRSRGSYVRLPRQTPDSLLSNHPLVTSFRWLFPKERLTILCFGQAAHWACAAAANLRAQGLSIGVLQIILLKPLELTKAEFEGIKSLCILEDHYLAYGIESEIVRLNLDCIIERYGWPIDFLGKSGDDEELLTEHGLGTFDICERIRKTALSM